MNVSLWRLAADEETYGDHAGRLIFTTPDGEDEVTDITFFGEWDARMQAYLMGWTIVPLEPHL